MSDNFEDLGQIINSLVAGLSPANRLKVLKLIAQKLQNAQQKNIKSNQNPDGTSFIPRAKKKLFTPETAIKFLYPKKDGTSRAVKLKSWTLTNDVITGHDEYSSGQLKSFSRGKIIKFLKIDEAATPITEKIKTRLNANSIKNKMFKKLSTNRYLKNKTTPNQIEIGFDGLAGFIANVHHYGQEDIISKKHRKKIQMPKRKLLGITPEMELDILENAQKIIDFDDI